jgi:hypothetical protein
MNKLKTNASGKTGVAPICQPTSACSPPMVTSQPGPIQPKQET